MTGMSNYPPTVHGGEEQIVGGKGADAWEAWARTLGSGSRCLCRGNPATVVSVHPEHVRARVDGQTEAQPFDWEDVEPLDTP